MKRAWVWLVALILSYLPVVSMIREALQPPPSLLAMQSLDSLMDPARPLVDPRNRRLLVSTLGEDERWVVEARWDGSLVSVGLSPEEVEFASDCMERARQEGRGYSLYYRCYSSRLLTGAVKVSTWSLWWLAAMPALGLSFLWLFLSRYERMQKKMVVEAMRAAARGELEALPRKLRDSEEGRAFLLMLSALREKEERLRDLLLTVSRQKSDLEKARRALEDKERLALVGTMASGIAHELGNPLASIMGIMEVWNDADPQTRKRLGDMVQRELRRMDSLIRTLLGAARPQSAEKKVLNIGDTVMQAWELVSHRKDASDVTLETKECNAGLMVVGSDELTRVFVNLFLNSVQAMAGRGKIMISCRDDGDKVTVTVGDTGPGVPPEMRDRIFDPFFTTRQPGEGTGLGLTAVMNVLESLGGSIKLLDRSGGAWFELQIPAARTDTDLRH